MKRYAAMFLAILILLNYPISTSAVEVIIGDDVYIVDNDVDLEQSVEINATSYDTDSVLDRFAQGEQNQLVEDFVAAMLIVDAFQHNDFLNSSELKVEKLLKIIPFVTGMEKVEVEKNGNVQKIWLSSETYFMAVEEEEIITNISVVFPKIKNGFGNEVSLDFQIDS